MMYKRKVVQYTMEGKPVKLYSSIREAEKKYGSFEEYMARALGVDEEMKSRMRARYLE